MNLPLSLARSAFTSSAAAAACLTLINAVDVTASFDAGFEEQQYLTIAKALSQVAIANLLWMANSRGKRASQVPFTVMSLSIVAPAVGRVYRDTVVAPEKRHTWSQITVNSCDAFDALSSGDELLSKLTSPSFLVHFTKTASFRANGNKVEINLVELASTLSVTLVPLSALVMLAVRHVFSSASAAKILAHGGGSKISASSHLFTDACMILPLFHQLTSHGLYFPFLLHPDKKVVETTIRHFADSKGFLVESSFSKTIRRLAIAVQPYSTVILPFFHIYYGSIFAKAFYTYQLVVTYAPEKMLDELWLTFEQRIFDLASFIFSMASVNPHHMGLGEYIPAGMRNAVAAIKALGIDSIWPTVLMKQQTKNTGEVAEKMLDILTTSEPEKLTYNERVPAALQAMRRASLALPPPFTPTAGQVLGQKLGVSIQDTVSSIRDQLGRFVPKVMRMWQQDMDATAETEQALNANTAVQLIETLMDGFIQALDKDSGLSLPPDIRIDRALVQDPNTFFKAPAVETEVEDTFRAVQALIEGQVEQMNASAQGIQAWIEHSFRKGKLIERLTTVCRAYPQDETELRESLNFFLEAMRQELEKGEDTLQTYIDNELFLSDNLKADLCAENGHLLLKRLGLTGKAFLSNTPPLVVAFLLDAHQRLEAKRRSTFSASQYLAAEVADLMVTGLNQAETGFKKSALRNVETDMAAMIIPVYRMVAGYLSQVAGERATNLHEVLENLLGDHAKFGAHKDPIKEIQQTQLQAELALELLPWILDSLHGPGDSITYSSLLEAGLGSAFAAALLPAAVREKYDLANQMRALEGVMIIRNFELMIPTFTNNGADAALQQELEARAQQARVNWEASLQEDTVSDNLVTPLAVLHTHTPLKQAAGDTPTVDAIAACIDADSHVASCMALLLRCQNMQRTLESRATCEQTYGLPTSFEHLDRATVWFAYGFNKQARDEQDVSNSNIARVITEVHGTEDWQWDIDQANPLASLYDTLTSEFLDCIHQEENQGLNYAVKHTLLPLIATHGLDILTSDDPAIVNALTRVKGNLPADTTLEAFIDTLTDDIPAELEGATLQDVAKLYEALKHEGEIWELAFKRQMRYLTEKFNAQLGPALMITLGLATPNADVQVVEPVPTHESFALSNALLSAPLSRAGIEAAPGVYKRLLVDSFTSLFPLPLGKDASSLIDNIFRALTFTLLRKAPSYQSLVKELGALDRAHLEAEDTDETGYIERDLRLNREEVYNIMRPLSELFEKLPSIFSTFMPDWGKVCALLTERYAAKPVTIKMQWDIRDKVLLRKHQESDPLSVPDMALGDTHQRTRILDQAASLARKTAYQQKGMEPPSTLTWEQLYATLHRISGDPAWAEMSTSSRHKMDQTDQLAATLAAAQQILESADHRDVGELGRQLGRAQELTKETSMFLQMQELWPSIQKIIEDMARD